MTWIAIFVAVLALAGGIWVGLGAPGWPHKEPPPGMRRKRLETRSLNPIQWKRERPDRATRRRR